MMIMEKILMSVNKLIEQVHDGRSSSLFNKAQPKCTSMVSG